MKSKFQHVALVGKYQTNSASASGANSRAAVVAVAHFLDDLGCDVAMEHDTALNMGMSDYPALGIAQIGKQCDLALVVGGDGTMLGIGRQMAPYGVPLIGINQGRLGFITDVPYGSFAASLAQMLGGAYVEDHRSLINARVWRDGDCVYRATAMNDVVVNRGASSGMVELRVEVDGHFVSNQRADGLIIATPTGSTAYALSAGGPLLHPSIPGWVMVPIAPHTLSNRPIVLANSSKIAIEVVSGRDASASFDTQSLAALMHGDRIEVTRSKHHVRFLHPQGWSYYDTLREKLHWNERVVAT
ncbi:NAD kinase [Rhodoferax sp.]|uniref:NAD kinase n=1 Tax=Rhodoferax sp. TaxID=50421 RepID=UPI0019E91789|nr:NAD kinase [Rhodoferax sp.]MBE0474481.1 NAD kinase [Rhodoferax sp.]